MERGIVLLTLLALVQSKLIDLSCNDIKTFVNGHNVRRLRLAKGQIYNQPAAKEMKIMVKYFGTANGLVEKVHNFTLRNFKILQTAVFLRSYRYEILQKTNVKKVKPTVDWGTAQTLKNIMWNSLVCRSLQMWDKELAVKAAYWASRNKFAHNPNKKVDSNRFKTGENIYSYSTTDQNFNINPTMALDAWFDEYKDYSYRPLMQSDFDGSTGVQIGHYTQMAWSDTIYVGCAISQKYENGWKKFLIVCNYGPSGNYLGRTPYRVGKASGALVCGTQDCSQLYGSCR